jgi:dihydrofolate reductase
MIISIIVAVSKNGVIGKDGGIPWRLPADMKLFKRITMGHYLIVGRETFDSIGRVLPGRKMIILSRQEGYQPKNCQPPDCQVAASLSEALEIARAGGEDEVFIGGGAAVYAQALPMANRLFLTEVHAEVEGDTFFPTYDPQAWQEELALPYPADAEQEFDFTYKILVPKNNKKK